MILGFLDSEEGSLLSFEVCFLRLPELTKAQIAVLHKSEFLQRVPGNANTGTRISSFCFGHDTSVINSHGSCVFHCFSASSTQFEVCADHSSIPLVGTARQPPQFSKETKDFPKSSKETTSFGKYLKNGRSKENAIFTARLLVSLTLQQGLKYQK